MEKISYLKKINNVSVVQQVIDNLSEAMLNRQLRPGDKIPTESELAESMGVGRNSIREAVKILVYLGVLEIRRAEGTFVCEGFSESMIDPMIYGIILDKEDSYENLMELREMMEVGVMQLAMKKVQRTVIDNICFPLEIVGVDKKKAKERARELLQIVDLSEKENAYPAQLSGGQKQRVAIARALATNPKILLCDEATSALDPTTTKSILALLKEINQKYGITIVIITHEMAVVQEIGTHVAIIDHGELAESGTVEEVFTHPKSKAARKLVLMDEDNHYDEMKGQHCIRIVFKSNSSFEPVIANMVLAHRMPVNILQADTKDINGVAHGQMILQLPEDAVTAQKMIQYLKDRNLEVEELDHYVG